MSQPFRTIALYKPYGVLCQFRDSSGRPTLASLVPIAGIYPAGRLDFDSEGLLLLTEDGGLAHRLTDPRFEHPKTYLVQVERVPDAGGDSRAAAGASAAATGGPGPPTSSCWRPSRHCPSGRFRFAFARMFRPRGCDSRSPKAGTARCARMTAAVGHPTLRLVRVAVGPISLGDLAPGQWRELECRRTHHARRNESQDASRSIIN